VKSLQAQRIKLRSTPTHGQASIERGKNFLSPIVRAGLSPGRTDSMSPFVDSHATFHTTFHHAASESTSSRRYAELHESGASRTRPMSAPPGAAIDLGNSCHSRSFLFRTSSRRHSITTENFHTRNMEASNKGREHDGFASDSLSSWTPHERFVMRATKRQSHEAGAPEALRQAITPQTFTADSLARSNAAAACEQLLCHAESTCMCMYGVWVAPHPRMYTELPRNACVCRDWTVLKRTLCEMSFIVQAITCEGLASLLDTIDFALSCVQAVLLASPSPFAAESTYTPARMSAYLSQLAIFLRDHRSTVGSCPDQLISVACSAANQGHVMRAAHTCLETAENLILQCEAQCEHVSTSLMMQGDASMQVTCSFWQLLTALDQCGCTTCLDQVLQHKLSSLRGRLGTVILDGFGHDTWQLWRLRVMRDASEHRNSDVCAVDNTPGEACRHMQSSKLGFRTWPWRSVSVFISCPLQQQSEALRAHVSGHVVPQLQAACAHMSVEIECFDLEQTPQEHPASPESFNNNNHITPGPNLEETCTSSAVVVLMPIECAQDGQARALWEGNILCLWVPHVLLRESAGGEANQDEPVEHVQEVLDQVCGLLCTELWDYAAKLADPLRTLPAPAESGDCPSVFHLLFRRRISVKACSGCLT
jgi:hypothetical protein